MDRLPVDIWDMYEQGHPVCITTNGFVKANGECVMGRGNAREAKTRFPALPLAVGDKIRLYGNIPVWLPAYGLFTFPVKRVWNEAADPELIRESARRLRILMDAMPDLKYPVYLPSPGTGNGRLTWAEVEPSLERYFSRDERLVVVVKPNGAVHEAGSCMRPADVVVAQFNMGQELLS